ncbi:transporter substrate-binding domain-containing protein [Bdellovibrio bacteriovorus]|uniref:substrate-binding periplasmic protein n=1 Tax=Bdellovibrio bacteriovorus TaxID=959 RepID=UPI0021D0F949|nr:transporter substrate-binding domain-containing protein [Bdellovibrio bacteriovorus]UXR65180.1 transporter substrate-binding domain-containing protein [Bdellovibrio bacteriovorus]
MNSVILTVLILLFVSNATADVIILRSDYWCPYVCNLDSPTPGYMVEIAKAVFEPQGHQVQITMTNWARSVKDARANKAQGIIGACVADAPDFIYPKNSLGLMKNAFFVAKGSKWEYTGRGSLQGKRIGVINGYAYGGGVDPLIRQRHRTFIPFSGDRPLEQMIRMLEAGRLDGFIENPLVLQYTTYAGSLKTDSFKTAGWVEEEAVELFISFSPNHPKSGTYAEILSKGVEELRRNGELQRILNKYNLYDWKESPQKYLSLESAEKNDSEKNPSKPKASHKLLTLYPEA